VRSFDQPPDFSNLLGGKEDQVFPRMRDVAMRCIEDDGADVICLGSTTMHQAGEYLAAHLPVPVVNPGPLTYKLVETFLALGLRHGRDVYPAPVEPRLEMLHAMMAAGARAEK
jgi:allantoin racemase